MAQAMINFRMDEGLKKNMEETSIDPFYSESNKTYLKKVVDDIESGKVVLVEHELIEE